MKYNIEVLKQSEIGLVDELAKNVNLDENIDYNCQFIVAKNGSAKILGLAGVKLSGKYPRFEHIIVRPEFQNNCSRLSVILMMNMERFLKENGYSEYISYILNTRPHMQKYAAKWGMEEYSVTEQGKWYHKFLNRGKNEKTE